MVHLKVAQGFTEFNDDIEDLGAFYKGALAPDAIMFRKGSKRSDKEATHFCIGNEGWGFFTNYDEWTNNLILNIRKYKGRVNDNFLFGYFLHVLADIIYAQKIWNPIRTAEIPVHLENYQKDCYEIDSRLLESFQNQNNLWPLFKKPQDYCNLPDIVTKDDMKVLINEMTCNMYHDRKSNPNYMFKIITFNEMLEFIENTVKKANETYQIYFI